MLKYSVCSRQLVLFGHAHDTEQEVYAIQGPLHQALYPINMDAKLSSKKPISTGSQAVVRKSKKPKRGSGSVATAVSKIEDDNDLSSDDADMEAEDVVPQTTTTQDDDDAPASRSFVNGLLDDLRAQLESSSKKAVEAAIETHSSVIKAEIFTSVSSLIQAYDEKSQKQFDDLRQEQKSHAKVIAQLQKDLADLKKDGDRLTKVVDTASKASPTKNELAAVGWDADPDPSILLVGVEKGQNASKKAVEHGIKQWLEDASIASDAWSLAGKELDRRFTLSFKGEKGLAALRAKKAFDQMRSPAGIWLDLKTALPESLGGGTGTLYIKKDQNEKERTIERDGKRLFKALKKKWPNKPFAFARREGAISLNWRLFVRVEAHPGDEASTLMFNIHALSELSISKEEVQQIWANIGSNKTVQWSV